ncbi:hypothetical protein DPMN_077769 [Dreissena polymorpha]|uniref:Homeobox domain-containing protein n=1 Tax=Dreissena polymorpha TaxID=45954 RepID=A0A9D3YPE9_DREPO|nr:hypothetical protein DPMN_077769 [Dreissena polymorpha]
MRPLIAKWRGEGKKIIMFLDDGFGTAETYDKTVIMSREIKSDLLLSGLVPKVDKSCWEPVQELQWLGSQLNTANFTRYGSEVDGLPEVLAEKVSLLPELLKVTKAENTHLSYKRGFNRWRRWGAGGATAAANNGIPDRLFKRHGRWLSETAKDGYVKSSVDERLRSPEETIGVAAFIVAYEEGLSTLIGVAFFIVAYEEGLCRSIAYEEGLVPAYSMPGVVVDYVIRECGRTTFTSDQALKLKLEYARTDYVSRHRRFKLAATLQLTESQIKFWFQKRRAKDKRIEKAQNDHTLR